MTGVGRSAKLRGELSCGITLRVAAIVKGGRAITADTALRLGRYFGTSPDVWLGLQNEFDPRIARRSTGLEIESAVRVLAA